VGAVNVPVPVGAVVIAGAAAAIAGEGAVTGVAAAVTAGGIAVDVRNAQSGVLNAVRSPMFLPASLALSNRPLGPSDPSTVVAGKNPRVKDVVGVRSVRRGKSVQPGKSVRLAKIARLVQSVQLVATKKGEDAVDTNGHSPNVLRVRPLRPQRKTMIPLAMVSGRPLLRRQRALTTPKSASAKGRLRPRNGVLDGEDEVGAAAAARRGRAPSDQNRVVMSKLQFLKRPDSLKRTTRPMMGSAQAWTTRLSVVGRNPTVRVARMEAVRRAASDPNVTIVAAASRAASGREVVVIVHDGTSRRQRAAENVSRDGGAAARSRALTRRQLFPLTTAKSRPGRKQSPTCIFRDVQGAEAAGADRAAVVVAREEAVARAAGAGAVVAGAVAAVVTEVLAS
jgi:hypothetical protein